MFAMFGQMQRERGGMKRAAPPQRVFAAIKIPPAVNQYYTHPASCLYHFRFIPSYFLSLFYFISFIYFYFFFGRPFPLYSSSLISFVLSLSFFLFLWILEIFYYTCFFSFLFFFIISNNRQPVKKWQRRSRNSNPPAPSVWLPPPLPPPPDRHPTESFNNQSIWFVNEGEGEGGRGEEREGEEEQGNKHISSQ